MKNSLSISVSSTINSSTIQQKAQLLAQRLDLPYRQSINMVETDFILAYTDTGLQLVKLSTYARLKSLLFVDFIKGKNGYRHAKNLTIHQPLAKATGIKSGFRPSILDATAGLGGDGFVLACLGCEISMCERSTILHALLEDGFARAVTDPKTSKIITTQITLILSDTITFLHQTKNKFHTVYLDPMYPHTTKSALNKQEMRVIRSLVGDDEDSDQLLIQARNVAKNRVVVKRPKGASPLSGCTPTYMVSMKNSRFDIYL